MPWSTEITRAFATIKRVASSSFEDWRNYGGPYNKLLHTLFPVDSDFLVSHDFLPVNIDGGADVILSFDVALRQHPVLVLQIQPPQYLSFMASAREAADKQICLSLIDLSERTPLPVLHGISAIGTKLRSYKFEKAPLSITPQRNTSDPELTIAVAPQDRWDCDVLEADGEQRLRALVTQVTEDCERLQV